MGDSAKKRPHDVLIMEDSSLTKKLNLNQTGENTYHLKLLIPSVAAGAIIGKGGETIAEIQKNVGARVKMSKPNDYYPGTNERVCLITGTIEAITTIVNFLVEKVKEKPDPNAKPAIDFDNKVAAERERQMKVLVPNSTAGMIIGKGGNYIKQIKEDSGSFIQISQKSKETTLPERVVTIIGDDENNKIALELILQKICEDPQSGSCLNISYSEVQGPVANFNPTGSPFAHGPTHINHINGHHPQVEVNGHDTSSPASLPLAGGGSLHFKLNLNSSRPPTESPVVSQSLGHINNFLRNKGYNQEASEEITNAVNILALHGVLLMSVSPYLNPAHHPPDRPPQSAPAALTLDPSLGGPPPPPQGLPPNIAPPGGQGGIADSLRATMGLPPPPPTPPHPANQGQFGPIGGQAHTNDRPGNNAFKTRQPGLTGLSPLPVNNNSFGLATAGNPLPCLGQPPPPPPGLEEQMSKIDIEVNESLVGAVLGPAGRSIVEIQQYSGAAIQISKKGTYSPGTRNRIVSITGPQKSLTTAQFLIEQRVAEEESKRQHNSSF